MDFGFFISNAKKLKGFAFAATLVFITFITPCFSQARLPLLPDSLFPAYYHQRATHFKTLPYTQGDIIFIGNSITDGGEWSELFNDIHVKNRGISGDITAGVLHRLDEVVNRKPAKIFLLIGTNDLARKITVDSVVKNILLIADYVKQESPATKLYVQSILPVNPVYGKFSDHTGNGAKILQANEQLKANAGKHQYTFIDLFSFFCDENGKMKPSLTNDGLHLLGEGYLLWKHIIYPYVYGLQPKASLLPKPQSIAWGTGYFPLFECNVILADNSLNQEASYLQHQLSRFGLTVRLSGDGEETKYPIVLSLERVASTQNENEAYHIQVTGTKVMVKANTAHGIFNAMQTLLQLARDGVMLDACEITDWPAFSWRGYMVDVGRNYEPMDLLEQQIDIMSRYKLNVFHFHATEDIAWRIESKLYPQLNAASNMLRNPGEFYSEEDIKELIRYCKKRHITFVPEIDMPGHSAAFRRAMKTDMQTDSGMAIVKNILKEFCTTYDVPYLHIGADEVKISNKNFLPEIISYVESLGKKVIGWEPGGNFTNSVIRELWMDDNGKSSSSSDLRFIDSRHLYLNHMDPLESVATIFFRQIGNRAKEDKNILGGTICLWPDRRVANEADVLKMNAAYPAMLVFAERSWDGGGYPGWVANIGKSGSANVEEFTEFENRLMDQKQENFKNLPFPYARQSGMIWKLYGPYANGGVLAEKFEPEQKDFDASKITPVMEVVGGTIVLRHWWYPLIKDVFIDPKENTTWYASTEIWSDEDAVKDFWIGFNNISRSPATDSPPAGAWDNKRSEVWVNNRLVEPPHWKHGGQKGNPEVPLVDEGYEYRQPTKIFLHKGWNAVLIKAPVGSFKGSDWQNPVKWMFTFIEVPE
ncbi:MAG: family 20 glycosylhydrolase [Bacteroidetes bacterium]|nr:family 20 glycosylhydrolase [Bacteroidota bacterium]MBS1974440.1 family 20 glycosylhydrolase [Bacteroidota bacterium]